MGTNSYEFRSQGDPMPQLEISLFGRFTIRCDQQEVICFQAQKVRELFSYLVLHHEKAHHRDQLADLLWGDVEGGDNKKYLRKALWKLKGELRNLDCSLEENLQVDTQWIHLIMGPGVWADVLEFEQIYRSLRGVPGAKLSPDQYQAVKKARELYRGDLFDGCYWDWCILDRERFRELLLIMINKLMGYCEVHGDYEAGIGYGNEILRFDCAHERTHRRMMRLYDLSGNRSEALRQYERCQAALHAELAVNPSNRTKALFQRIARGDSGGQSARLVDEPSTDAIEATLANIKKMLVKHIHQQEQLSRQIQVLEETLRRRI
jgi:DNA-binding SARP family transcriptional activator